MWQSCERAMLMYHSEISSIVDRMISVGTVVCRQRPSDPYFDEEYRAAKRHVRQLERASRRVDVSLPLPCSLPPPTSLLLQLPILSGVLRGVHTVNSELCDLKRETFLADESRRWTILTPSTLPTWSNPRYVELKPPETVLSDKHLTWTPPLAVWPGRCQVIIIIIIIHLWAGLLKWMIFIEF